MRRIVLVKRVGRVSLEDLRDAGIVSSCDVPEAVESCVCIREGNTDAPEVSVRLKGGTPLKTLVRRVERAVLNAALRKHHGQTALAMRELQVTKDVWYRVRRG